MKMMIEIILMAPKFAKHKEEPAKTYFALNNELSDLCRWASELELTINPEKFAVLQFGGELLANYTIHDEILC